MMSDAVRERSRIDGHWWGHHVDIIGIEGLSSPSSEAASCSTPVFSPTGLIPDSMMTEFTLFAATGYVSLALVVHLGAFVAAVVRATHRPDGS